MGRFQIHRYELRSRTALNAAAPDRRTFPGALLHDTKTSGYGCIHPWPELGDAPLNEQLASLASSPPDSLPLASRAIDCARIDGEARLDRRSLFEGLTVPSSHHLWQHNSSDLGAQAKTLIDSGFDAVKVKLGAPVDEAISTIDCIDQLFSEAAVRLRIDFNSTLDPGSFLAFIEGVSDSTRKRIELVEDPFINDPLARNFLPDDVQALVAVDRDFDPSEPLRGAAFGVLKPAVDDFEDLHPESGNLLVTSYMDHPVGQLWAAYGAARIAAQFPGRLHGAGLLTHQILEGDPALDLIESDGPHLVPPSGTGLGLDSYLQQLNWRDL